MFNELQVKQIVFSCRHIHQYNAVSVGGYKQFGYLVTLKKRMQSCALDSCGLLLVNKVLNFEVFVTVHIKHNVK
jgi:hypothetical protein